MTASSGSAQLTVALLLTAGWGRTRALDNGLARTPPMGWMSWQRFRCNTDCKHYPDDCISEHLVKSTADALVQRGFRAAGYRYVSIDDCWLARHRSARGRLLPDPARFPSGIRALADYLHARGLKLGIYQDTGNLTCAGYPGSAGHYQQDARTFADWKVDMVKLDGCYTDKKRFNTAWVEMSRALNKTGRPMLYNCEWPVYLEMHHMQENFTAIAEACNTFRSYDDINDSWESLQHIFKYFGEHPDIRRYAGPGGWNDPDELIVGDYGLSVSRAQLQMALWCVMAAPLYISADVRHMKPWFQDILLNKLAISISQMGQVEFWRRAITPKGSYALAIIYTNIAGGATRVSVKLSDLGLHGAAGYNLTNVFTGGRMGLFRSWYTLDAEVDPTSVLFIHAQAVQ